MSSISVSQIIKGKGVLDRNRGNISVLMGIITRVYEPNKKHPGFEHEEGHRLSIPDRNLYYWIIHCANSTAASGIPRIEYVKLDAPTNILAVFKPGSSTIDDKNVRRVHGGLQSLVNGFLELFPETRETFEFYIDEAAHYHP